MVDACVTKHNLIYCVDGGTKCIPMLCFDWYLGKCRISWLLTLRSQGSHFVENRKCLGISFRTAVIRIKRKDVGEGNKDPKNV